MKNKNILIFVGLVIAGLLIGSSSVYFMMKANEKKCEKCAPVVEKAVPKYGNEYFETIDKNIYGGNAFIADYLSYKWIKLTEQYKHPFNYEKEYKDFIDKLYEHFDNVTTHTEQDVVYTLVNDTDVYIKLESNGTYHLIRSMCEDSTSEEGTYDIINDQILLVNLEDDSVPVMFYFYEDNNILKSISYEDCGFMVSGTILVKK